MERILEAYADMISSPESLAIPEVNFYEDDSSGDDDKEESIRGAKFDRALLKFYMSNVRFFCLVPE